MEAILKTQENHQSFFGALIGLNCIECLLLQVLITHYKRQHIKVPIKDITYDILAGYWHLDTLASEHLNELKLLGEIRNKMIHKYGLNIESDQDEIIQVLHYMEDRKIEVELYAAVKNALRNLVNILDKVEASEQGYWRNTLQLRGIREFKFYQQNGNQFLQLSQPWMAYIQTEAIDLENITQILSNPQNAKTCEVDYKREELTLQRPFEVLETVERHIIEHMSLDKKCYGCLEEALEYLEMNFNKYEELHQVYILYLKQYQGKATAKKYPLVTAALLINTAIYRYNDEECSGYWPEFFGGENAYSYQRDVAPIMETLGKIKKYYAVDAGNRHYMQKINLSEIFSQIYLPEVSLKKIFSAIYSYYYKGSRGNRLVSITDFIEGNEHRLDKPGYFFIKEDTIIEDVFEKIVEMMEMGLSQSGVIDRAIELPSRFFETFEEWYNTAKKVLDSRKEDYAISVPKIRFDTMNESIDLYLPKQKSREYSDAECGWRIKCEQMNVFIDGRLVRERSGAYVVLDETVELEAFQSMSVEYVFNNKIMGKWQFVNHDGYILFDHQGTLVQKNVVKRDGCIIGIKKDLLFNTQHSIATYENPKWAAYVFHEISLKNYQSNTINLGTHGLIKVEEQPVIERVDFKILFEAYNKWPIQDGIKIYQVFGKLYFDAPHLDVNDFAITLTNLKTKVEKELNHLLIPLTVYRLWIDVDRVLDEGIYQISIRYKNRTIYREGFVIYRNLDIINTFTMSYEAKETKNKRIMITKNKDIEVIASHQETAVNDVGSHYAIIPSYSALANFDIKVFESKICISTIVRPIEVQIIGIDSIMEQKGSSKIVCLTKEVFNNEDIRVQITNYDNQQDWLIYSMTIQNHSNNMCIKETHKIRFGDTFTWQLKAYRDRVIDYENMVVSLGILNDGGRIIHQQELLEITQKINIINFKAKYSEVDNTVTLKWSEKQHNKKRRMTLYNFTVPHEKPSTLELEEGQTQIEIDLKQLKYGIYMVSVDYKKEKSLFEGLDSEKEFVTHEELKNVFVNKVGMKGNEEEVHLSKLILNVMKGKNEEVFPLLSAIDLRKIDLYALYYGLLQLRYAFKPDQNGRMAQVMRVSSYMIQKLLEYYSKDKLIEQLFDMKDELKDEDIRYLVTLIVAFNPRKQLSGEVIEKLAEIDLINALCAVENGAGKLPMNLVTKCKEHFDPEVLGLVRKDKEIYSVVRAEIEMISDFWHWLTEHKNRYLLKNNYSKARMFRIYQQEKGITTNKLLGSTIDELVDSMTREESTMVADMPSGWLSEVKGSEEVCKGFSKLMQVKTQDQYKEVIVAAFIAVTHPHAYTNNAYFELIVRCYFSKRRNLFNRYRAYFKLIFI